MCKEDLNKLDPEEIKNLFLNFYGDIDDMFLNYKKQYITERELFVQYIQISRNLLKKL